MQTSAPSFQSPPPPRSRRIRPPNADPRFSPEESNNFRLRSRQRARLPAPAPTVSFSTTSSASAVSREPLNSVVPLTTSHRFQNFPSSSNTQNPREGEKKERNGSRKLRKKLRVVTRPSVRFQHQRPTMRGASHSNSRQPSFNSPDTSARLAELRSLGSFPHILFVVISAPFLFPFPFLNL